jgi:Ribonuclease G/E
LYVQLPKVKFSRTTSRFIGFNCNLQGIQQNIKGAVAPAKILSEQTKTTSILRDLLNEDFNKIVVNDKNIFTDTKNYIQK